MILSTLLIVAGAVAAPTDSGYPEATEIFRCFFDEQSDTDFDGWPDGWTRRQGPGFPHYVKIEISDDPKDRTPAPRNHRPLRIDLDGGGAVAYTAPIPIRSLFNFVAEGYVQTHGLKHDRAYLSLTLLDRNQQALETFYSEKMGGAQPWKLLRLGPVSPTGDEARFAVLGLHLQPQGPDSDLRGSALFGDLWIGRLPRMVVSIQGNRQVLRDVRNVVVTCHVSGVTSQDTRVHFELLDALGKVIEPTADERMTFESADPVVEDAKDAEPGVSPPPVAKDAQPKAPSASSSAKEDAPSKEKESKPPNLIGTAVWKPAIPGPGFYRVSVSFPGRQGSSYFRQITLAVITPQRAPSSGEFGWSLPHAETPLGFPAIIRLLADVGVNWVKYPLWFGRDVSDQRVEDLIGFNERLAMQGIEVIGVLGYPPDEVLRHFEALKPLKAADIFSVQPDVWFPSLETVMSRLGTQVRWWQLGADNDNSFVGYSELLPKVLQVRSELNRIGRDVNVGVGWSWRSPFPELPAGQTALRFFSLSATPPLEAEELADFLSGRVTAPPANGQAAKSNVPGPRRRSGNGDGIPPAAGAPAPTGRSATSAGRSAASAGSERPVRKLPEVRRFVLLEPQPRQGHSVGDRAKNLVQQMLSAKIEGAEGIFVSNPFHRETGLMNDDGSPGELLLPWRTIAMALAGSEPLGTIYLPQGSANHVFARANDAVLVAWNSKPVTEQLYLGSQARQTDLWGRDLEIGSDQIGQTFQAGRLPTVLTGLHKPIALWQVGFALDRKSIPSVFGARHPLKFEVTNRFEQPVDGKVTFAVPQEWTVQPQEATFHIEAGKVLRQPFEVTLSDNASSGPQLLRADFELNTDQRYRFSIYRRIRVGLGDVDVEITTRLTDDGQLEVRQCFINEGRYPVSFRCYLFAPDRRRQTSQVVNLFRGQDIKTYLLPDGKELVNKTLWLQAQELGGPGTINYRFIAKP